MVSRCRCSQSAKPTDAPETEQKDGQKPSSKEEELSSEVKKLQEDVKDIKVSMEISCLYFTCHIHITSCL